MLVRVSDLSVTQVINEFNYGLIKRVLMPGGISNIDVRDLIGYLRTTHPIE